MKRHLPLLILVLVFSITCHGQARPPVKAPAKTPAKTEAKTPFVFEIEAGSRAPWGTNQHLVIDANGKCDYRLSDVEKGPKDSLKFSLAKGQIDTLLKRSKEFGFFKLDSTYVHGVDGGGVFIAIMYEGKGHFVDVVNRDVPQIRKIVDLLNEMLLPHKITIRYAKYRQ